MDESYSAEKSRHLEAEVAHALAAGGYAARRNVVREGRSGARHEIDVLAEKGDGLTTFSLMVECKAWDRPVDKEVLAKAAFVGADVGADKTIVVALQGATGGAALSAAELGVELWGPEELERRLGRVVLAARLAERERAKGMLGLGAEEVAWFGLLWLPCLLLTLGCTRQEGRLRKRARHSSVFNLYEAIDGSLLESFAADPTPTEVEVAGIRLPARVKARTLHGEISTTLARWRSVVQEAARERWVQAALELGVPLPVEALTIDHTTVCWLPIYAAVLVQRGARRVVVIDAGDGSVDHHLGGVLTENLGYLTETLAEAAH